MHKHNDDADRTSGPPSGRRLPAWAFDLHPGRGRAMSSSRGRRRGPDMAFGANWGGFPLGGHGGPPGPFGRRGRGGRGRRAARGDVRTAVLALLAEHPMHGYQIIQELAERTDGAWQVSPGSIYPTLQVLEDVGLVRAEKSHGKRVFHLTDEGREAVESTGDAPKPWDEVTNDLDHGLVALRDEIANVGGAAVQIAQAGSDDQIRAAKKVLVETRRKLYLLLAEVPDVDDDSPVTGEPTDGPIGDSTGPS